VRRELPTPAVVAAILVVLVMAGAAYLWLGGTGNSVPAHTKTPPPDVQRRLRVSAAGAQAPAPGQTRMVPPDIQRRLQAGGQGAPGPGR
jgi:hypothetical protein